MNLYIWNNPYAVNYGASLLVVAATSLDEAKRKASKANRFAHGYKQPDDKKSWAKFRSQSLGEPSRVLSGPDIKAEWHEWSE